MNIFRLDDDPKIAAIYHCDKHVVKMIVESAQMLSTAHRILDGTMTKVLGKKNVIKHFYHPTLDNVLYKAFNFNHPSTLWTRESSANYAWHYDLFVALADEYTYRYGKVHATDALLRSVLKTPPQNIKDSPETLLRLAMKARPDCMFPSDPVKSYRLFYQTKQDRIVMKWKNRPVPSWFIFKDI